MWKQVCRKRGGGLGRGGWAPPTFKSGGLRTYGALPLLQLEKRQIKEKNNKKKKREREICHQSDCRSIAAPQTSGHTGIGLLRGGGDRPPPPPPGSRNYITKSLRMAIDFPAFVVASAPLDSNKACAAGTPISLSLSLPVWQQLFVQNDIKLNPSFLASVMLFHLKELVTFMWETCLDDACNIIVRPFESN